MAYGSEPRARIKWVNILILLVAVGAVGYIWWIRNHKTAPGGGGGSTAAGGGDSGPAQPGDILYLYDRSAEKWLQAANEDFAKNKGGSHRIVMKWNGSREAKQDILYGKLQPVLWTPADVYWIDKLNLDWTNPKVGGHSGEVVGDSRPILRSMFVLIMWNDRARVFEAAMRQPKYHGKTWALLSDLGTKGWGAVGGPASWGKLRLAQTDPTKSNSGQAAITLMFNEYRREHSEATPNDPGFVRFMRTIEDRVGSFGETTSKLVEETIANGSQQADMACAYESNAITALDKSGEGLHVVYPEPTLIIEFPAAILKAPWVTTEQADGAKAFVDYLLTPDVQKRALQYGLRPTSPEMRGAIDNALASGYRGSAGFKLDPLTVQRPVSTRDVDSVLYAWYRIYGKQSALPGGAVSRAQTPKRIAANRG